MASGIVHGVHHHPWRELRDELPEWSVAWEKLPAGILGLTDYRTREIVFDIGQLQVQRRCTLTHELLHIARGDTHSCDEKVERWIERQVARKLVPFDHLVKAVVWARNLDELADELWVDLAVVRVRIGMLHPAERAVLDRAVRDARGH